MKKIILWLLPALLLSVCAGAQQKSVYDPDLIAKVKADAAEVFKNHMEYATPEYMKIYLEHMSRLEIKTQAVTAEEGYPLLSSVMLVKKYNPMLERDNAATFDPLHFNALKYAFDYQSPTPKIYRVDGTSYIIVIHPAE